MAICNADQILAALPLETQLLDEVVVRLLAGEAERQRHDDLLAREHYLHHANAIGHVLRYVAEYRGEWVAALKFCSAALPLKPRDQFLHWPARQVRERRHLLAQNSRFLVLPATARWPNLASRVLQLACARLAQDWQNQFGHPVLLVETFVAPPRFRGTCYRAANWQALGRVRGYWGIETQQHYRRDHTPREDHCQVREPTTARNLSRMRSLAIFLYEQQRGRPRAKRSRPDWQRKNQRQPHPLIARFMGSRHDFGIAQRGHEPGSAGVSPASC